MQLKMPHWLTIAIACVGAVAGVLVGFFPQYAAPLGLIASICTAGAAPTITKGDA